MDPTRRALLPFLLSAAGAAAIALAAALLAVPVPEWLRVLLPVCLAAALLGVAVVVSHGENRARRAAEEKLAARDRDASQLRHDLRGILSPAMLVADRLTANPDPAVRRAGETMVATVERAEQRLRRNANPPAA